MNRTGLLLASAIFMLSGAAAAQTIIAPTSAVINSGGPGFGSINDTFNQAGLSSGYTAGVTNFDSYIAGNPTHTTIFSNFEWFSNQNTSAAVVTYDFGAATGIDRLALWNEEASGIGSLSLSGSLDGVTFTALGSFSPTDNVVDYSANVFSFGATSARYVRFDMGGCPQANPGGFPGCAIGEVAFRSAAVGGAVPEPASWALMVLGIGAVGGVARRRRQRTAAIRFA